VIISSRRKSSFKSEGRKEAMKIVDRRACLVNEQVTVVMYRFLFLGIIFTIDQSIGPGSDRADLLRFT
jgi:preprotein translocase subunit SecE